MDQKPAANKNDRYYIPILFVALIISAYAIGSMRTKTQYLKQMVAANQSGTGLVQPVAAAGNNQPTQPNQLAAAQQPTPPPAGKPAAVTETDHILGNKNAKVTLVEYSDYECPFCKRFHPTMQEVMKTYGDKVRLVYRHFPLPFHTNAQKEAEASECINELGGNEKFWAYTDAIFERTTSNGTGFALDQLGPLAKDLGINQTAFQSCLDSGKYTQHVQDNETEGQSVGVSGTPGTFVVDAKGNAKLVEGAQPTAAFKTIIDQALAQ